MLKRCAIILLLLTATALFAWLATCTSCTVPELSVGSWRHPERYGVGQPFRLDLHTFGGLTPPNNALFRFHALDNIECQQPLSWHLVGICRKGLRWKATIVAWPVNVGVLNGSIATYLPQNKTIAIPTTVIPPSGNLSPIWLDSPPKKHLADIALTITMVFCALPFCLRRRKYTLNESLLERLRHIQHPAVPCLAYLFSRRNIATYSGFKEDYDNLETHCRKMI